MPFGQIHLRSKALQRTVTFSVILPDAEFAGPGPYPGLLQLHGAWDDHQSWSMNSKIRLYAEGKPLVVVMPDGGRSAWSDWVDPKQPVETFIISDLLPACESMLPIRAGRWAVGGNSMGGYGSLHLGLKHPDRFASIYAHSSVIWGHGQHRMPDGMSEAERAAEDLYLLADQVATRADRPVIGMDCGLDDGLLEEGRAFHDHLDRAGYAHSYADPSGGHTWDYWDEHVQTALRQHLDVLSAETGTASGNA